MSNETDLSRLVARALDSAGSDGTLNTLKEFLARTYAGAERAAALESTPVYQLEAHQPGFEPVGEPGYLSLDLDLRQAVLHELATMAEADFEREEHATAWQELQEKMAQVSESQYSEGLTVSCPDDFILSLLRMSCAEALRSRDINPETILA